MIYRVEFGTKFYLIRAADEGTASRIGCQRRQEQIENEHNGPAPTPTPTNISSVTTRGPIGILAEGYIPTSEVRRDT